MCFCVIPNRTDYANMKKKELVVVLPTKMAGESP